MTMVCKTLDRGAGPKYGRQGACSKVGLDRFHGSWVVGRRAGIGKMPRIEGTSAESTVDKVSFRILYFFEL